MERVISKEEIVNLHMVQQLERKKALAVNLILARERQTDKVLEASDGMLTREDFEHYEIGMNVSYPNGSFPKQFFLPNYFRGENAYFPTGKSAVYRQNTETAKTALQAYEEDIMMSDEVKECKNIPVFPGILAEHSGVASDWMSFTSNFDEALFYACCICDKETGEWRPLENKDFQEEGQADARYGVIYMADAFDSHFREDADGAPEYNVMTPAGSQPFMSSQMQYAYAMHMREEDDIACDRRFDRLVFKHTEELCKDIYERMDRGAFLTQNNGKK